MEYSIKQTKTKNGQMKYIPEFSDEDKLLLTHFFYSEVPVFSEKIQECIQKVISGKADCSTFAGNSCELVAGKDNSTIRGIIDGMDCGTDCVVSTEELKNVIEQWQNDRTEKQKVSNRIAETI